MRHLVRDVSRVLTLFLASRQAWPKILGGSFDVWGGNVPPPKRCLDKTLCRPVTNMTSRQRLRSANRHLLHVLHGIGLTRMDDELLLWLDRRLGTLSRTISGCLIVALTVSNTC